MNQSNTENANKQFRTALVKASDTMSNLTKNLNDLGLVDSKSLQQEVSLSNK